MRVYLVTIATIFSLAVKAQAPAGMQGNPKMAGMAAKFGGMMNIGKVYGKVLETGSKKPVPFANVTVTNAKDSVISGTFTKDNGDFVLDKLPLGKLKVTIKTIGFEPVTKDASLGFNNAEQELGNFYIKETAQNLKEVTVSAEKATVELKLDRKVVNVEKDLSSKGGTALDVMKNVPGVNVGTDDEVTLRNGSPTIYVDGRPTTLTLRQIPADQIQSVEVITNPSAKYEASAQGGILNVVMKKNNKPGYNGIVSAGAGTNNQYNTMAMLNLKEQHFGASVSYNINGNRNNALGYTNTETILGGQHSYVNQDINSVFKRQFQFARVGFDYFINNRNTVSISGNIVNGNFHTNETQLSNSDSIGIRTTGTRTNLQNVHFQNLSSNLNFKHTFPKQGKEYAFDFTYSANKGGNSTAITGNTFDDTGALLANNRLLENQVNNNSAHVFTGQWDFTNPLENEAKLEFGARLNSNQGKTLLNAEDYDYTTGSFVNNNVLSNNYQTSDVVAGAYVTYGKQIGSFGYQLGLRYESSWYKATLLDKNQTFEYSYPNSASTIKYTLFPSLNTSYKYNSSNEFQFNISRKINRPNFFQTSPFIFSSNSTGYQIGNPQIKPEFINKAEVNHSLTQNAFNLLTSLYANYNENPIASYNYIDANGKFVSSFGNAAYAYSYGIEPTLRITKFKNLDITLNGNAYYTKFGTINSTGGNDGWSFNSKAILGYKLPYRLNFQLNGNYNAPRILPQGHTKEVYFADASLSKDMGLISFNLTLSDIFNSRRMASETTTDYFIVDQSRRRDVRFLRFGVTIRFGKMDASLFKMKKKGNDTPSMNMGEGF